MVEGCKQCGDTTRDMWPSLLWFPGDMLCEDCHDKESDEIKEEEGPEDEAEDDFHEELMRSHMYSWCII